MRVRKKDLLKLMAMAMTLLLFSPFVGMAYAADNLYVVEEALQGVVVFGQQYAGSITDSNTFNQYTIELAEPGRLSLNIINDTFSTTNSSVISTVVNLSLE
jgi:hypothetical protein